MYNAQDISGMAWISATFGETKVWCPHRDFKTNEFYWFLKVGGFHLLNQVGHISINHELMWKILPFIMGRIILMHSPNDGVFFLVCKCSCFRAVSFLVCFAYAGSRATKLQKSHHVSYIYINTKNVYSSYIKIIGSKQEFCA